MPDVAAMILAAGTSSRMGQTKQLLDLGGASILERVIHRVLRFEFTEVVTVIGNDADDIRRIGLISDERFQWVDNPRYRHGQSSSLKKGMSEVQSASVMVFLGDQPFISDETIQTVFDCGSRKQSVLDKPFVVRPGFREIPGHPVFFGNVQNIDFSGLEGDEGARNLIRERQHRFVLSTEDCGTVFDIDTPEDYEKAKQFWERSLR